MLMRNIGMGALASVALIYAEAQASDNKSSLTLTQRGTHAAGVYDEGAAEIVTFAAGSKHIYVVNGDNKGIDVINVINPDAPAKVATIDFASASTQSGKTLKAANSCAVYNGILAVAVENKNKQDKGVVAFYSVTTPASPQLLATVETGALPDMVTFSKDGRYVIAANEGEPDDSYKVDPEGSVTIIDVAEAMNTAFKVTPTAKHVMFTDFNKGAPRAAEFPTLHMPSPEGTTVAQDLEPEYVAVSNDSRFAFVSFQENNGFAVIDIAAATVKKIFSFGTKDYSKPGNELDVSAKDKDVTVDGKFAFNGIKHANGKGVLNMANYPHLVGMYQPDAIAYYEVGGEGFLVTANEGDARDYDGYSEETKLSKLVEKGKKVAKGLLAYNNDETLGGYDITAEEGQDANGTYVTLHGFGARSFSIWRTSDGKQVFDSGNELEKVSALHAGKYHNASNSKAPTDKKNDRSKSKGPEPEALAIGQIGNAWYAFVGLERVGGIAMYDITKPADAKFITYVNNRDFTKDPTSKEEGPQAGDVGPEGIAFVPAAKSPSGKPMIIVANEVSGTTTLYDITTK